MLIAMFDITLLSYIGGREYPELRCANDTVLLTTTPECLEKMTKVK